MLTIVVIDEEISMRTLLCEWLGAEGYRVCGRSDRCHRAEPNVDLVIVDLLNLPAQGAEALRQVRNAYPGAALIGISTQLSRSLSAESRQARALGVCSLVTKPRSWNELLWAVFGVFGGAH